MAKLTTYFIWAKKNINGYKLLFIEFFLRSSMNMVYFISDYEKKMLGTNLRNVYPIKVCEKYFKN